MPGKSLPRERSERLGYDLPKCESRSLPGTKIKKAPIEQTIGAFEIMPGNDLLSHGETPHYHRRSSVSLLSSEWDQVGPERYCCQANRFEERSDSKRPGLDPGSYRPS